MPSFKGVLALRLWGLATAVSYPLIVRHLRRRIGRGKEHPTRWREKLGFSEVSRPDGCLIWCHAVGLGEVLALRGAIHEISKRRPDASFLVTSNTRASQEVFSKNLPENTIAQFAPIDVAGPSKRFLDRWKPDLSIWAEQELWPGLVKRVDDAGIPLALINARMNADAFGRRRRAAWIYSNALERFSLVSAQDKATADNLTTLGALSARVDGSIKQSAPALAASETDLAALRKRLTDRFVWMVGSSHSADEEIALEAQKLLLATDPNALCVIVPRDPTRGRAVLEQAKVQGLEAQLGTDGLKVSSGCQVFVADSFGQMGLWYRLARVALIGGTFGETEGHNPWEAIALGKPVLSGPRTANFTADFRSLIDAGIARGVDSPRTLLAGLDQTAIAQQTNKIETFQTSGRASLDELFDKVVDLLPNPKP